jgi:hypothetical protein
MKDNYRNLHSKNAESSVSSRRIKRARRVSFKRHVSLFFRKNLSIFRKKLPDIQRGLSKVGKATLLTAVLFTCPGRAAASPNPDPHRSTSSRTVSTFNISEKVAEDMQRLWGNMNRHLDILQDEIRSAKKSGKLFKKRAVKRIFDYVCPRSGFDGSQSYCVAGAMYVHKRCNDDILNSILPDTRSVSSGNPLTYCNATLDYYKQTLGKRAASSNQSHFRTVLNNLKPGDIIFIRSSRASSGKHCMTVAGTLQNGKIYARGLNSERSYNVPVTQIVGAVNLMDEYCDRLTNYYTHQQSDRISVSEPVHELPLDASSLTNTTPAIEIDHTAPSTPVASSSTSRANHQQRTQTARAAENSQDLPEYFRRSAELNEGEVPDPLPLIMQQNQSKHQR